jgi:hypothetical protein
LRGTAHIAHGGPSQGAPRLAPPVSHQSTTLRATSPNHIHPLGGTRLCVSFLPRDELFKSGICCRS